MEVLYATAKGNDFLASCVWDGLQELLGQEHVWDANDVPCLHNSSAGCDPCARVSSSRHGRHWRGPADERASLFPVPTSFDLLVVNAAFLRERDWHWPLSLREYLKPGGKVAYLEGWDGASEVHNPYTESDPPFHVDAIFRREIDPRVAYPYECHCLMFAAPSRWFCRDAHERPSDVVFSGHAVGDYPPDRWEQLRQIFQTTRQHRSVAASMGIFTDHYLYFRQLQQFKLGLSPAGGGWCGDCMRHWELIASGVIPIFCGYQPRVREPWFDDRHVFTLERPEQIPALIDHALSIDLRPMREAMQEHALTHHTTKARAEKMLRVLGI